MASRTGLADVSPAARSEYRKRVAATFVGVAFAFEFVIGGAAFIAARVRVKFGIPLPDLDPTVPLAGAVAVGLAAAGLIAFIVRPRPVSDGSRSPRGGQAEGGGGPWTGAALPTDVRARGRHSAQGVDA